MRAVAEHGRTAGRYFLWRKKKTNHHNYLLSPSFCLFTELKENGKTLGRKWKMTRPQRRQRASPTTVVQQLAAGATGRSLDLERGRPVKCCRATLSSHDLAPTSADGCVSLEISTRIQFSKNRGLFFCLIDSIDGHVTNAGRWFGHPLRCGKTKTKMKEK